jgi:Family of unknown function (DUF5906)
LERQGNIRPRGFQQHHRRKACVLINEADDDKIAAKAEDLKDLLHKGKVTLNPKHVNPYEADNTPLYFISSNDPVGGLRLDRSDADRRYSVSRSEDDQTLLYWLCQRHPAWTKADARAWLTTEGLRVSRDKTEVGRWLWHLASKHGPSEAAPPEALHGADFADLFSVQKKIDEALCEAVFLEKDENGDNAFSHIQLNDLERGYAALGGKLSVNKFREKVKRWLKKHGPHIDQKRIDYQTPGRAPSGMARDRTPRQLRRSVRRRCGRSRPQAPLEQRVNRRG